MRYSVPITLILAALATALLGGCTSQQGSGDQAMHSTMMQSATDHTSAGRGVEDPGG